MRSDHELLSGIAGCDGEVFSAFYRRHLPRVLAYLVRETGDREVAADLTAEVFAAVMLAARRYRRKHETAVPWLLGRPTKPYGPDPRGCGIDHVIEWPGLSAYFGQGRFVGYNYQGRKLSTNSRGLRVGDTLTRGRQAYGAAFKTSASQGGSWSVETATGRLIGYLSTVGPDARIATIEAGNVGCAAVTP
jgi:hypothetical protein